MISFKNEENRRRKVSSFVSAIDATSTFPFIFSRKSVNLFLIKLFTELILRKGKFILNRLLRRK